MTHNTYLVTGAAEFIGSNLCKQLLATNKSVIIIGLDNYNPYYSLAIKRRRTEELLKNKRYVFIQSSFYNKSTLRDLQKKYRPKILIHTAAEVGVRNGELHPTKYIQTNVLGTAALLETIGNYFKHIVLLSSSSVYGNAKLPFHENDPLFPTSVYGLSKMFMENYARSWQTRTSIPITTVRPFSVYGPDGRPDMLPIKLLRASLYNNPIIINGKNIQRDWTYIDDVVWAIVQILNKPKQFEAINLGAGTPISNASVIHIAQKIASSFGHSLIASFTKPHPVEAVATRANTNRLRSLGINTPTPFRSGFQKTAERYFQTHEK